MTTYPNLPQRRPVASRLFAVVSLLFAFCLVPLLSAQDNPGKKAYDIPADDAERALKTFAHQSGLEVLFVTEATKGVRTLAVKGEYTPREAIDQLLAGTPLTATQSGPTGAFKVRREKSVELAEKNVASRASRDRAADLDEKKEEVVKLDTFEVFGRKTLNMDIQRTRDDVQPYVVFDSSILESSGATNLEDFLRTRLPMNTHRGSGDTLGNSGGKINDGRPSTTINLRGLGANQTLILVDGRRMPAVARGGSITPSSFQPDINGIPISAVERIDILPSTASGIYGGGATGGVVNIILKRQYSNFEYTASYGDTFDAKAANYEFGINGGFTYARGKGRVFMLANYRKTNPMFNLDREFQARSLLNSAVYSQSQAFVSGYTSNIRSAEFVGGIRQPLVLDSGASLGSAVTSVPMGYAGPATDNGVAFVTRGGVINVRPADDTLGGRAPLILGSERKAFGVTLRHDLGKRAEVFAELNFAKSSSRQTPSVMATANGNFVLLPGLAPNNPFQQSIEVLFPTPNLPFEDTLNYFEELRTILGVTFRMPGDWLVAIDHAENRTSNESLMANAISLNSAGATAIETGALDVLRDLNAHPLDFGLYRTQYPYSQTQEGKLRQQTSTIRASGAIFKSTPLSIDVSGIMERRNDIALDSYSEAPAEAQIVFTPQRTQLVHSGYLEARVRFHLERVPRLFREFEMQAAFRYDNYLATAASPISAVAPSLAGPFPEFSVVENETTASKQTLGVMWNPRPGLTLRTSRGTGFLPPGLDQIVPRQGTTRFGTTPNLGGLDRKRGNTPFNVTPSGTLRPGNYASVAGGSPALQPELSESTSVGVILKWTAVAQFRASVDYTHIEKQNEIRTPSIQNLLDYEDSFPGRVMRGPSLPGDPAGWAGAVTGLDRTLLNFAHTNLKVFDVQMDASWRSGQSHWTAYALATRQTHLQIQVISDGPMRESVGMYGGPLAWRGNCGVTWQRGSWTLGWNMQYYDAYKAYSTSATAATIQSTILQQGSDEIPAQRYHDLYVSYDLGSNNTRWLKDTHITVGIQNALNVEPPFSFLEGFSRFGDPRLRRFTLSIRKLLW